MANFFYLGPVLKQLRLQAKLVRPDIAKEIGSPIDMVRQIEMGMRSLPNWWKVERWIELCGADHLSEACKKLFMVSFRELKIVLENVNIDDRLRCLAFRQWVESVEGLPQEVKVAIDKHIGQTKHLHYKRDQRHDKSNIKYKTFTYNTETDTVDLVTILEDDSIEESKTKSS
jgi:hypothetical protein